MAKRLVIDLVLAFLFFPVMASTQAEERAPGFYAVVDGEYIALDYSPYSVKVDFYRDEIYRYKGETSSVRATDRFVIVTEPKKSSSINPKNIRLIHLKSNAGSHSREFSTFNCNRLSLAPKQSIDFEWTKISDNSFEIKIPRLRAGEYGFISRPSAMMFFNYTKMFGFTISYQKQAAQGQTEQSQAEQEKAKRVAEDHSLLFTEVDERNPGLYAIVKGRSIPMEFTRGTVLSEQGNYIKCSFRDESSYFPASDTFVLVINPDKIVYTADKPYFKTLTPSDILVKPMTINANTRCRELEYMAFNIRYGETGTAEVCGLEFEWEQISKNSYSIKLLGLKPGEYGLTTRPSRMSQFDFKMGTFDFTVPSGQ